MSSVSPKILQDILDTTEAALAETIRHDRHFHNVQRVIGAHSSPDAEINCGEAGTMTGFSTTAGDDDFNATPICILGTGDGPFVTGNTVGDGGILVIEDVAALADNMKHMVRLIYGSGTFGEALSAEQFSDAVVSPQRNASHSITRVPLPRITYGTDKLWFTHWVDGVTNPSISFHLEFHGYPL